MSRKLLLALCAFVSVWSQEAVAQCTGNMQPGFICGNPLGTGALPRGVIPTAIPGIGNVVGPTSAVSGNFASYNSITGKLIADAGGGFNTPNVWTAIQTFTASPLVPTASPGDNTTKAASTAFVQNAVSTGLLANPSATIGLTAVNGSAATGIRSDGAPALSQAIVPFWTGLHTFTKANLPAISVLSGASGSGTSIWIGRATVDYEIGVAGSVDNYFTGTIAGDTIIQSGTKNIWLGAVGFAGVKVSSAGVITFPQYGTGILRSSSAGVITSGLVSLTAEVSGVLPVANGGTNSSTAAGALTNLGAVPLAGGTMTGLLVLSADPSTNLGAATKQYVDAVSSGIQVKPAAAAATTANVTLSGEQTIDTVVTSTSIVLVKNNTAPAENGLYTTAAGAWTRITQLDTWAEAVGAQVFITGGSANINKVFTTTVVAGGTINVTAMPWTQTNTTVTYTAGAGLTLAGAQFSIAAGAITNTMLAGSIAASKLTGTDITTVGALTAGSLGSGFTVVGSLLATAIAAPGTPAAGKASIFVDSTTKTLKLINDAGTLSTTVIADTGASNNFLTGISAGGVISKAQPTFSNLATGTSPAFTLGGTVSGGTQQINNLGSLGIGAVPNVKLAVIGPTAVGDATSQAATFAKLFDGSATTPHTSVTPSVSIYRYDAMAPGIFTGDAPALRVYVTSVNTGAGNPNSAAISGIVTGGGVGDFVGIVGIASRSGSAGFYSYGGFFDAETTTPGSQAFAIESFTGNSTGVDISYSNVSPTPTFVGVHIGAGGTNLNTVGIWVSAATGGGSAQWDVGLACTTLSTKTACLIDDSSSVNVMRASGVHTNGINLASATFSGTAFSSPAFSVGGQGNVTANGYAGRAGSGGASSNLFNIFWNGSAAHLWIDTSDIGAIQVTSDYRTKRDVEPVSTLSAFDEVMRWRPVSFKRRAIGIFQETNDIEFGFIAHELQTVTPSAVYGAKDALDRDGNIAPQSLVLAPLIAQLTGAVQNLKANNDNLVSRIDALEQKAR